MDVPALSGKYWMSIRSRQRILNLEYPNIYSFVRLNIEPGKAVLRRYNDTSPGFWASDTLTYENARDGAFAFDYRIRKSGDRR